MIPGVAASGRIVAAPTFSESRALASRAGTANQGTTYPYSINYGSEASPGYDYGGWHDTAVNPSRMVVPAGVSYVRLTSNFYPDGNPQRAGQIQQRGGANFLGQGCDYQNISGHSIHSNAPSAIVPAVAGEFYHNLYAVGSLGGLTDAARQNANWFAIEAIDPSLVGALTGRVGLAEQSLATGGWRLIEWADPVAAGGYDLGGYWSAAQPTRFTVPEDGVYRFSGSFYYTANDASFRLEKNGVQLQPGVGACSDPLGSSGYASFASYAVECVAGDYFEIRGEVATAGTLGSDLRIWFSVEKVNPLIKRALIGTSASKTITAAAQAISCANEYYDTSGMANLVANNDRIFFPSGVTKARAMFGTGIQGAAGKMSLEARRFTAAGAQYPVVGCPTQDMGVATLWEGMNAMGAWLDVNPGDYFQLYCPYNENSRTFNAGQAPWLYVECL